MYLWLCMFFIEILSASSVTTKVTVTVSPATVKRKFYKVSRSTATWLDAISTCRQEGYTTLIYSSTNLETFKTVRKALQRSRGYSNVNVWTGFMKNYYNKSNTCEWFRELKCTSIKPDQYNIKDINTITPQCVYSSVTDNGNPIITLHADDCRIQRHYVCYRFENPPVPMGLFMDDTYYFNFSYNNNNGIWTTEQSSISFAKCTDVCTQKRYCVVAVFSSASRICSIVSYKFEEQINVTLHRSTQTGIQIAVKHGDEVIFEDNTTTAITKSLTELPCRTTATTSVFKLHMSTSLGDVLLISPSTVLQSTQMLSWSPSKPTASSFQQEEFTKSFFEEITPLQSSTEFKSTHFTQTSSSLSSFYESELTTLFTCVTLMSLPMNVTCSCTCMSDIDVQGYITKLDKRQLSLFRRRFYSVSDNRLSSKIIGNTGLLIIIFAILSVVIIDLSNFANHIRNRKRQKRRK